jgi:DNA-binding IclR family transcriptional regulator
MTSPQDVDLAGGDDDSSSGRRGIQSVGNAARVLEALTKLGEASNLGAVSQASHLSTSQTHRYLASLIAAGLAQQDAATGRYDLGPAAIKLGLAALARTDAVRIAEIAISDFVRRTGRTVQVCALGPLGPTVIRWYCGVPPVVTSLNVGSLLSLLHSATGHVFLAFSAREEIAPLVERELAADSVVGVDVESLRTKVRSQGFASVSGTVAPGLRATAFPIFDLQGRPILSATVIASDVFKTRDDDKIRADLGAVCAEVSLSLGGRQPVADEPTKSKRGSTLRNAFDSVEKTRHSDGPSKRRSRSQK